MNRFEGLLIKVWPWVSLLIAGILFTLLFPDFTDIQNWIFKGLDIILFPVWFLSGGIFGLIFYVIWTRWPRSLSVMARRSVLVIFGYIGVAIVIALVTGSGEGIERVGNSGPVKIWGILVWGIISMSPSLFGILAIMKNSKWARGASVLGFITLSASTMIYSQASSARSISQDPFLSIAFLWALLLFVEGLNWKRRYWEKKEEVSISLWRRQASFTVLFLGAGSLVAMTPFLLPDDLFGYFEWRTLLGKALIGAILLIPFGIAAIIKNVIDRKRNV